MYIKIIIVYLFCCYPDHWFGQVTLKPEQEEDSKGGGNYNASLVVPIPPISVIDWPSMRMYDHIRCSNNSCKGHNGCNFRLADLCFLKKKYNTGPQAVHLDSGSKGAWSVLLVPQCGMPATELEGWTSSDELVLFRGDLVVHRGPAYFHLQPSTAGPEVVVPIRGMDGALIYPDRIAIFGSNKLDDKQVFPWAGVNTEVAAWTEAAEVMEVKAAGMEARQHSLIIFNLSALSVAAGACWSEK